MLRSISSLPALVVLLSAISASAQSPAPAAPASSPPTGTGADAPRTPPSAASAPESSGGAVEGKGDTSSASADQPANGPAAAPVAAEGAPTGASQATPGVSSAQAVTPSQPGGPGQGEPVRMGEQPGGTIYGGRPAQPPPGYRQTGQTGQAGQVPPHWGTPGVQPCGRGFCGPHCRQRCRRNEYCTEYGRCEPVPQLDRQEHRGLLLRATTGYGFGALSAPDAEVREGSLAIGLGLDIGSAVIENLIVRGRARGMVSYFSDNAFGSSVLYSFGTLGAGVDYYIMPINIYVGGTVSVAGVTRTDEDHVNRSKAGLGLDFDVGKEWWVGRRWGIGLALRVTYIDCAPANILRISGIEPANGRLRSVHVGLQFSATFN